MEIKELQDSLRKMTIRRHNETEAGLLSRATITICPNHVSISLQFETCCSPVKGVGATVEEALENWKAKLAKKYPTYFILSNV